MYLWVSSRAMHPCMSLSPVNASSDGPHTFIALVRAALLVVGWWGGFSSHMFTPASWCIWHLPIGFLRVYSKNLVPLEKTWGLYSILKGSHFNCLCPELSGGGSEVSGKISDHAYNVFLKWGYKDFGKIVGCFRASWLHPYLLISLGVSALFTGLSSVWLLIWWRFRGILLVPQFPVITGAYKFSEVMLPSFPVNMLPILFFCRLVM